MKAGDKTYISWLNNGIILCEFVAFYSFATIVKTKDKKFIVPSYNKILFYACGYSHNRRCLFLKKKWHYPLAIMCECFRLLYWRIYILYKLKTK